MIKNINNETLQSGEWTFSKRQTHSLSPIVPTAKEDTHAVNLGQVEGMIEGLGGRAVKAVPNLSQYTIQASDFDRILVLTASNGATIDLILNAGVAPVNGELQVISINNNKIRFVAGDGVDVFLPEGATDTTVSRGWLGGVVFATDRISINGSLESTGGGGTAITNITQIPNRSYNDLQDLPWGTTAKASPSEALVVTDKNKIVLAGTQDYNLVIPAGVFSAGDRVKILNPFNNQPITLDGTALTKFYAADGKTTIIKGGGKVELYFYTGDNVLVSGDLVEEYTIRQSPNGTLWKVSVDNSGNEVITAL